MLTQRLIITWQDGSQEEDTASGNTPRALSAAVAALTRSYERDGAKVEAGSVSTTSDRYVPQR